MHENLIFPHHLSLNPLFGNMVSWYTFRSEDALCCLLFGVTPPKGSFCQDLCCSLSTCRSSRSFSGTVSPGECMGNTSGHRADCLCLPWMFSTHSLCTVWAWCLDPQQSNGNPLGLLSHIYLNLLNVNFRHWEDNTYFLMKFGEKKW